MSEVTQSKVVSVRVVKEQINILYGNTSVTRSKTRNDLESIKEHVQIMLETLNDEDLAEGNNEEDDDE